jgi:pyrimidine-specific ribonucleoside hydrolase
MSTPLVIDTDPGVDDAFAIALAAGSPEVDLLAVTTVYGNVPVEQTTRNALRLLALCEREDVVVASGAARPLVYGHPHQAEYAHGADGLGGRSMSLPEPRRASDPRPAIDVLAGVLASAGQPVTVAAIGPLTNIALLLAVHPEAASHIDRLVVMGGALSGGNVTEDAEFNIWSDPEAARRVIVESDVPVTLVPLDFTHRARVTPEWLRSLSRSGGQGEALVSLTHSYRDHYRRELGEDTLVLHDAVAVAEAVWPGILHCLPTAIDIMCGPGPRRGALVHGTSRKVGLALDADLGSLRERLLNRLGSRAR